MPAVAAAKEGVVAVAATTVAVPERFETVLRPWPRRFSLAVNQQQAWQGREAVGHDPAQHHSLLRGLPHQKKHCEPAGARA